MPTFTLVMKPIKKETRHEIRFCIPAHRAPNFRLLISQTVNLLISGFLWLNERVLYSFRLSLDLGQLATADL